MVAYSFKRRFVTPIQVGLGIQQAIAGTECRPKRQTIRAIGKRRHARAGETLQLYHGMRTRQCFLIGNAVCTDTKPIRIELRSQPVVFIDGTFYPRSLTHFARADGFEDWAEMREFWRVEHPGVIDFEGVIIFWKPL